MDWVDKPQNYKDLYGILQTLRGSHLNNFPRKFLKLGWVACHSVTFQLKSLDFQSNQYKKLVPVLSRFCNCLYFRPIPVPFNPSGSSTNRASFVSFALFPSKYHRFVPADALPGRAYFLNEMLLI